MIKNFSFFKFTILTMFWDKPGTVHEVTERLTENGTSVAFSTVGDYLQKFREAGLLYVQAQVPHAHGGRPMFLNALTDEGRDQLDQWNAILAHAIRADKLPTARARQDRQIAMARQVRLPGCEVADLLPANVTPTPARTAVKITSAKPRRRNPAPSPERPRQISLFG